MSPLIAFESRTIHISVIQMFAIQIPTVLVCNPSYGLNNNIFRLKMSSVIWHALATATLIEFFLFFVALP